MPPIFPRLARLWSLAAVVLALLFVAFQVSSLHAGPYTLTQEESQAKSESSKEPRQPADQPVIRIKVDTVPLSVQVVDGKGRPVTDLRREDFEIYENGVLQQAVHFLPPEAQPKEQSDASTDQDASSAQSPQASSDSDQPADPAASPDSRPATAGSLEPGYSYPPSLDPDSRSVMLVLGRRVHLFGAPERLAEFVKDDLGPQDRVGVSAYGLMSPLMLEKGPVVDFLERFAKSHERIEGKIRAMGSSPGLARNLASYQQLCTYPPQLLDEIQELFDVEGLDSRPILPPTSLDVANQDRQERLIELMSRRPAELSRLPGGTQDELGRSPIEDAEIQAATGGSVEQFVLSRGAARADQCLIFSAIATLRYQEDEKMIIFLNSGGLAIPTEEDGGFIRAASDARVRIFTIQTGGFGSSAGFFASLRGNLGVSSIRGRGPNLFGPGSHAAIQRTYSGRLNDILYYDSLHDISDGTGGRAFISEWPGSALRKIRRQISATYLLGYAPQESEFDGRFRKIEVRVTRPGLKVRHRAGYFAFPPPDDQELKQEKTRSRTESAAYYPLVLRALPFEFQARLEDASKNSSRVMIDFSITPPQRIFSSDGHLKRSELVIGYFFFGKGQDRDRMWSFWDKINLDLRPEVFEGVTREGFDFQKRLEVPLASRDLELRVVVYNPLHDLIGSSTVVKIE